MEVCKKNPSNHSFRYNLSFHANKETTYCCGSTVEATAERHEDGGEGRMRRAQLRPLFKGDPAGLVGDLGKGQDTCQVETAGRALSNSPLKSAVTPQESLAALSLHEAWARSLCDGRVHSLRGAG